MRVALVACLAACTTTAPDSPTHMVTWSATGMSDSPGEPDPIVCTAVISHPCPFLLYVRELAIEPDLTPIEAGKMLLEWSDATGGADSNGRIAEQQPPVYEDASSDGATLTLADVGDSAGDRHVATLTRTASGYEGDVTWSLFTVAGHTTWHLTID